MADPIDPKTQWVGKRPKRHAVFPAVKEVVVPQGYVRGPITRQLAQEAVEQYTEAYRARQAEMKALAAKYVQSPKKKQKARWKRR
jgi:hypothetical protein